MTVIVVVHRDHNSEEARNRRHVVGWCRAGRSSLGTSVVSPARMADLPRVRVRLALLALGLERQRRPLPRAPTGSTNRLELLRQFRIAPSPKTRKPRTDWGFSSGPWRTRTS